MTSFPCIKDTSSIALTLGALGLTADAILDPDSTNALRIDPGLGIALPIGPVHSARVCNSVAQNCTTADPLAWDTFRWDTTGNILGGIVNGVFKIDSPGLWMFGASVTFNVGASVGTVAVSINVAINGVLNVMFAIDGSGTQFAYAPFDTNTGTITCNPCGFLRATLSDSIIFNVTHDFGGTIPTVASSSPATGAVAGTNEMAGSEFWCVQMADF
jgi:hypothetical protein